MDFGDKDSLISQLIEENNQLTVKNQSLEMQLNQASNKIIRLEKEIRRLNQDKESAKKRINEVLDKMDIMFSSLRDPFGEGNNNNQRKKKGSKVTFPRSNSPPKLQKRTSNTSLQSSSDSAFSSIDSISEYLNTPEPESVQHKSIQYKSELMATRFHLKTSSADNVISSTDEISPTVSAASEDTLSEQNDNFSTPVQHTQSATSGSSVDVRKSSNGSGNFVEKSRKISSDFLGLIKPFGKAGKDSISSASSSPNLAAKAIGHDEFEQQPLNESIDNTDYRSYFSQEVAASPSTKKSIWRLGKNKEKDDKNRKGSRVSPRTRASTSSPFNLRKEQIPPTEGSEKDLLGTLNSRLLKKGQVTKTVFKENSNSSIGSREGSSSSSRSNSESGSSSALIVSSKQKKEEEVAMEPFWEVRMLVVGKPMAGKTSLLQRLRETETPNNLGFRKRSATRTDFNIISSQLATDGIEITKVPLNHEGSPVTLHCWDFAGQEIYYVTHQLFLSEKTIYLVVFSFMEDTGTIFKQIDFWLNSISLRAKDSPILIVGTHTDRKSLKESAVSSLFQTISNTFSPMFKNIVGYLPVSSKTSSGIPELKNKIISLARTRRLIGELIPTSYIQLMSKISEYRLKYSLTTNPPKISRSEFDSLCHDVNIPGDKIHRVTEFLRNLGEIVHFGDTHSELQEIIILDPKWLIDLFKSVIGLSNRFIRDGKLYHSDLIHIWKPPQYPTELHPYLIALMEKFEISYSLKNLDESLPPPSISLSPPTSRKNSSRPVSPNSRLKREITPPNDLGVVSLIPSLLPDRPDVVSISRHWGKPTGERVGRIYKFRFFPLFLFSRLIVRFLNLSKSVLDVLYYWKNGLIVKLGDHPSDNSFTSYTTTNPSKHNNGQTKKSNSNNAPTFQDMVLTSNSFSIFTTPSPQTQQNYCLAKVEIKATEYQLELEVRGQHPARLLRLLIENVEILVEGWGITNLETFIPCTHCFSEQSSNSSSSTTPTSSSSSTSPTPLSSPNPPVIFNTSSPPPSSPSSPSLSPRTSGLAHSPSHENTDSPRNIRKKKNENEKDTPYLFPIEDVISKLSQGGNVMRCNKRKFQKENKEGKVKSQPSSTSNLFDYKKAVKGRTSYEDLTGDSCSVIVQQQNQQQQQQQQIFSISSSTPASSSSSVQNSSEIFSKKNEMQDSLDNQLNQMVDYILIEELAPDLVFSDLSSYIVPYSEFQIIDEIDKGGFSNIYKATFRKEIVVVKQLQATGLQGSNEFQREVWIMSQLKHPNILEMKAISIDNSFCLVLEYCPFGTLYNILANRERFPHLSWSLCLKISWEISKALQYLHSKSIIHRDVKSTQILIKNVCETPDQSSCRLSDFGLSRSTAQSRLYSRQVDNYRWLAPEILNGEAYTEKADVYSFAVVLWEIITRSNPFEEYKNKFKFIHQFEEAIVHSSLRPTLPHITNSTVKKGSPPVMDGKKDSREEFQYLITQCWKPDPSLRWSFSVIEKHLSSLYLNSLNPPS